ncbi:hypothetical protein [Pseudorhodoferax sp. Leaf267]|nr:hypothetical protein [Pseudorhodoferax sp. Leaf267]
MMNFSLWFALAFQQGQKMSQVALWPGLSQLGAKPPAAPDRK